MSAKTGSIKSSVKLKNKIFLSQCRLWEGMKAGPRASGK
jgi:hypothetical protein